MEFIAIKTVCPILNRFFLLTAQSTSRKQFLTQVNHLVHFLNDLHNFCGKQVVISIVDLFLTNYYEPN